MFRACQNNDFALPLVVKKLQDLGVTKIAISPGRMTPPWRASRP